jgi:hypothetical protein
MRYAIRKDGKYLSSLFPEKFEADEPIYYWYRAFEIASDIARQLGAEVVVI